MYLQHDPTGAGIGGGGGASAAPNAPLSEMLEPSRVETERVFDRRDYRLYSAWTALFVGGIALFFVYWLTLPFDAPTILVTLVVLYLLSVQLFGWYLLPQISRPRPMPPRPGLRVGVATTFVADAESLEMLEQTLTAMVAMEYPHDSWVLDESDDSRVRELCDRVGARHFSRKGMPHYHAARGPLRTMSKVGNFNAWLQETGYERYDVIVGFDPDHVPEPDYLLEVLGYFADPAVGYVQAPQVYYNQEASFIARGAAEETYAYYSTSQMASFAWGYPIVTGSHHVHRTEALREVGGLAPHDADDLLITIHYRAAGWRGVYVPKVLARGLTPVDWSGYLRQQLRWARSVLDIKIRQFPRLAHLLPLRERLLGFLHGAYYLQSLWILVALAVLCYLLVSGERPEFVSFRTVGYLGVLFLAGLPAHYFSQRFYLQPHLERGLHLRARLLRAAKWPYLLWALVEVILGRERPYTLTAKAPTRSRPTLMLWPHLVVAAAVGLSWATGVVAGHALHPLLHLAAAATVVVSIAIVATETLHFPPPFQAGLHPRLRRTSGAGASAPHSGTADSGV